MDETSPSLLAASPGSTEVGERRRLKRAGLCRAVCGVVLLASSGTASAFTATLTPAAPLTVYLQVGVGSFSNGSSTCPYNGTKACYTSGGQPQNNATINIVSATVASTALGNGTAQAMTTNSAVAQSFYDGYTFCTVPGQLYIGGFYRTASGTTAAAQVTATVPTALIDATGDTLPFSKISWTSTGIGDSGTEIFPAGSFVGGGVQTVGSMASNTWNESCWSFSYLNNTVPAAGTFTGTVLYTLSAP